MLSRFEIIVKAVGPIFSFLGTSLLEVTPTFGEADVIATKQKYLTKTRG